jgi:hypothetical protein
LHSLKFLISRKLPEDYKFEGLILLQIARNQWKAVRYMSISDPHIAIVTYQGMYLWNRISDETIQLLDNIQYAGLKRPVFSRETTRDGKQKVLRLP